MKFIDKIIQNIAEKYYTKKMYSALRRSGNTTRLADYYIQLLFTKKEPIQIKDHYNTTHSSKRLARIISDRLQLEHKRVLKETKQGYILGGHVSEY